MEFCCNRIAEFVDICGEKNPKSIDRSIGQWYNGSIGIFSYILYTDVDGFGKTVKNKTPNGVVIDEVAADMNSDGVITVADVVLLRRFLVA